MHGHLHQKAGLCKSTSTQERGQVNPVGSGQGRGRGAVCRSWRQQRLATARTRRTDHLDRELAPPNCIAPVIEVIGPSHRHREGADDDGPRLHHLAGTGRRGRPANGGAGARPATNFRADHDGGGPRPRPRPCPSTRAGLTASPSFPRPGGPPPRGGPARSPTLPWSRA